MRILDRSIYVGPSHFARFPVIRLELDLGELEAWPTGKLGPAFVNGLVEALPGLAEHGCSYQEPGGFIRRMNEDEGTWLGHVLEHVALELQNVAGEDVTFGKTRSLDRPGLYSVVYEYAEREEGIAAGELAMRLLCSLLPEKLRPAGSVPEGWDWPTARDQYIKFAQRRALGPSTASLVHAAEKRNIPWLRLNDQSLIQLGHGRYQQRIQATVTGRTPHISVELASDKEETNRILAALGLPVPRQELVQNEREAIRAANRLGYPVVTKPYNGNHGRGISIRLTTDEEVARGFATARDHSRSVIVETYLEGDDHRLLVVNGELVAATKRTPGPRHRRRRAHGPPARRRREPGPAPRRRPREGADAPRDRPPGADDARARGPHGRVGSGSRPRSLPALDREPLDRRHRDRRHRRDPSGQSRHGGARGEGDRARRRRRRLPVQGHHALLPRDRRRHLRDQRGAGFPHARRAVGRHGARRCRARDRHAVSARGAVPRADRGHHRHERQDDDRAHARARPQDGRLHTGPHDDRRRVHRRPAHRSPAT
jgi:hypothetical protein